MLVQVQGQDQDLEVVDQEALEVNFLNSLNYNSEEVLEVDLDQFLHYLLLH